MKKILRLTSFCILHSAFCISLLAQVASQPPYDGNATNVVRGDGSVGAFLGSSGATYAAVTNGLSLTGSTATFLRSDGTQSGTSTGTLTATNFTATGTGANTVPTGTTAERPANATGQIRWNSTTSRFEHNIGASWENWVRLSGDTMTGPITAPRMTIGIANLTTLPVDGLFLTNTTLATVGVQIQDSPAIYWSGNAWLTGSASNAPVVWRAYGVPVVGASAPGASLFKLDSSSNGAAFVNDVYFSSDGDITSVRNITSGNSIQSAGAYTINNKLNLSASANGVVTLSDFNIAFRATLQFNQPQVTKTSNYTIAAALDSGLRIENIGASAAVTNTLPTAVANQHYNGHVDAAQITSFKASGSDKIQWGSTLSAAAGDIWSSQVGSTLHLFSPKALLWVVDQAEGAWTLVAPRVGNSALVAGTVTVANTTVTANTVVILSRKTSGGTLGTGGYAYTTTAGTGFVINAVDLVGVLVATDTSTISWKLEEIPN